MTSKLRPGNSNLAANVCRGAPSRLQGETLGPPFSSHGRPPALASSLDALPGNPWSRYCCSCWGSMISIAIATEIYKFRSPKRARTRSLGTCTQFPESRRHEAAAIKFMSLTTGHLIFPQKCLQHAEKVDVYIRLKPLQDELDKNRCRL